ncbi:MAG: hypothetical protein KBG78_01540 [Dermatophilaceae bacterium]|uniref:Uncharacterized protein n=1 Tax=Candidatus Phosphoribacter hodrii TaxID=2953743 RepID=A0A9D7T7B2_9MICO|nr:hypothetical protein [Candidatus Phosphoribacter hodrii]MBP8837487.1 hypothetical protein [Dermatophilaceae bacterium]HOI03518.1 hypothetical protein [Dermatophilaceae bacterium]
MLTDRTTGRGDSVGSGFGVLGELGEVDDCPLEVGADVTGGGGGTDWVALGVKPAVVGAAAEPSGTGAPRSVAASPAREIAPHDSPAVTLTTSTQVAAYRSSCARDPLIGSSPCCA